MNPIIHPVFEPKTRSWQYIVACPKTKDCAIIDPVLDFDLLHFAVNTEAADFLISTVRNEGYNVTHILETHIHADHLSAAYYIQSTLWTQGQQHALSCIGENVTIVQRYFANRYNIPERELQNCFDHLFHPDETFQVGELTMTFMDLPGHTPDHGGYKIESNVFVGDTVFNPDVGSGRCDFPGGDAKILWQSLQRLLSLPPETRLYVGHDYPPNDEASARDPVSCMTVQEQNDMNKHLKHGVSKEDFIEYRTRRDHDIPEPELIHQAMQVNVRGGKMPGKSHNGKALMQVLVNVPKVLLTG